MSPAQVGETPRGVWDATNNQGDENMIITGQDAIEYAARQGIRVNKYADPIEEARQGITLEEAEEVAREDAALIWITVPDRHQPPPWALGWSPPPLCD